MIICLGSTHRAGTMRIAKLYMETGTRMCSEIVFVMVIVLVKVLAPESPSCKGPGGCGYLVGQLISSHIVLRLNLAIIYIFIYIYIDSRYIH